MLGRIPIKQFHNTLSSILLIAYDLAAVVTATILAIILRFEYFRIEFFTVHTTSLPMVLFTYILTYYFFRLYRFQWEFAGIEALSSILSANVIATTISVFWQLHIDGERMPRSIIILTCLLTTLLVGGQRLLLRVIASYLARGKRERCEYAWQDVSKRVVILGSGQSAVEVLAALAKDVGRYEIVGILDDDRKHQGAYLRGIKILGPFDLLHDLLHRHAVDEVIIALSVASSAQLREYVLACCRHKVAVRVVPVVADLLDNPTAANSRLRVQDITAEDLLHRPPLSGISPEIGQYVTGRRVMVTGAGGSIGSELCRQISNMNPSLLILLGHGENSIYAIQQELKRTFPELAGNTVTLIADVQDETRINQILAHYTPQVVFHAAAHKHVPMMEENPTEAVKNNVGGTRNLVRAVIAHHVERMVLISTDKAVNPSSVMGATKFLCEEIARAAAQQSMTDFVTVRFGNVLGSRGSVLPFFQEQLYHGGPLTVTHPEVNRYFMTIPEAVSLVLQAGACGQSGNLFVLDMGRPIRIVDLAEDVIRLSGLEPYRDIQIKFCGLRPGEKISEELFTEYEQHNSSPNERMFIVNRPQYLAPDHIDTILDELLESAYRNNDIEVLSHLAAIIPAFAHREVRTIQETIAVEESVD